MAASSSLGSAKALGCSHAFLLAPQTQRTGTSSRVLSRRILSPIAAIRSAGPSIRSVSRESRLRSGQLKPCTLDNPCSVTLLMVSALQCLVLSTEYELGFWFSCRDAVVASAPSHRTSVRMRASAAAPAEPKKTVWVWTESRQVMTAAVERGWSTFLFGSKDLGKDWSCQNSEQCFSFISRR